MITIYLLFIQGSSGAYLEQPSKYPTAQACESVRSVLLSQYRWHSSVCIKAEIAK